MRTFYIFLGIVLMVVAFFLALPALFVGYVGYLLISSDEKQERSASKVRKIRKFSEEALN